MGPLSDVWTETEMRAHGCRLLSRPLTQFHSWHIRMGVCVCVCVCAGVCERAYLLFDSAR